MFAGKDHTLWALQPGWVKFAYNVFNKNTYVSVISENPNQVKKERVFKYGSLPEFIEAKKQKRINLLLEKEEIKQSKPKNFSIVT